MTMTTVNMSLTSVNMSSTTVNTTSVNSTAAPEEISSAEQLFGYISLFGAITCFTIMPIIMKLKMDAKDGMFLQWLQCSMIFMGGLVVQFYRQFPRFSVYGVFGGLLFSTGNVAATPILLEMGVGLGMLTWGTTQIFVGWAVDTYGMFGLLKKPAPQFEINCVGLALTLFSGFLFVLVYMVKDLKEPDGKLTTQTTQTSSSSENDSNDKKAAGTGWFMVPSFTPKKTFFVFLTMFLGTLHGTMFSPIRYEREKYPGSSQNDLDYLFSLYCGIYAFSTIYFVLYAALKKGRPYVDGRMILPGVVFGILWAIGGMFWNVANQRLSQAISFPFIVKTSAVLGAVFDVFWFKTIKGRRKLIILSVAVLIAVVGVILIGYSGIKPGQSLFQKT